jgi:tyrosine-protein kinase Etk/Wzc
MGKVTGDRENYSKRDYSGKLVGKDAEGGAKEAYERLFSALTGEYPECRVVAVSSSKCAEGKSLLCANLAKTASNAGYKTVIIECDMRCPALGKILGVGSCGALGEILGAHKEYDSSLITNISDGLDALLCGSIPAEQHELLGSETMRELISHLRSEYDFLIIDTPPAEETADVEALSSLADCFILSAREGYSDKKATAEAERIIKSFGGRVIGVVENGG